MHAIAFVVVPDGTTRETAEGPVTVLLEPYREDENGGWWDWWRIGGRATGFLDPNYSPDEDPANIVECDLCEGTGTREDWLEITSPEWVEKCGGCNGCQGKGRRPVWPTCWVPFAGDVAPLASLNGRTPNTFVAPGFLSQYDSWNGKDWAINPSHEADIEQYLADHPGTVVAVVDFHC